MNAVMMLRKLAVVLAMTQLSGAFRENVRGAVPSSAAPKTLLAELESALGAQEWVTHELHEFEEHLKGTFKALPKNNRGAVDAPSARYALHRFFIQRHGWMVKGLETGGGAWDAESPISAMGSLVPTEMKELFETRLGNYGLTLHELAVLAATMVNMFERDVEQRLRIVYAGMNVATEESLPLTPAHDVMLAYVACYVAGPMLEELEPAHVKIVIDRWQKVFPRWKQAALLLTRITTEIAPDKNSFDFALMAKVLSKFGQRLGALEDTECQVMKERLVTVEHRLGSGRVRLGDFFSASKHFRESAEFLRDKGALDESNPEDPKVLIPNYLHNPSNCLTPSGYYSVCCFDECESLMDQIESGLEAPMGTPEKITSLVSSLGSSNKTLSSALLRLLDDVAAHHGGMVPVHGRLFSQWMHQAYPRECSFPHVSAAVDRYQKQHAFDQYGSVVEPEDKIKYGDIAKKQAKDDATSATSTRPDATMWTMHEELVDKKAFERHVRRSSRVEDILLFGTVSLGGFMIAKMMLAHKLSALWPAKSKLL